MRLPEGRAGQRVFIRMILQACWETYTKTFDRREVTRWSIVCGDPPNGVRRGGEYSLSGVKALNKPAIFVFPKLVVCLGCGLTQFKLEGQQVELLRDNVVSKNHSVAGRSDPSVKGKPFG
jgi:hypothetical protein